MAIHLFEKSLSQGADNRRLAVSYCGVGEEETRGGRHSMALVRSGSDCAACAEAYLTVLRASVNYAR